VGKGNQSEQNISILRAQRRQVTERAEPGYQERVREIDQRIAAVMTELNQAVAKARRHAQEGDGK
jgi:membrane-anchored protein YejM (alkaline phosphatase superfamily)